MGYSISFREYCLEHGNDQLLSEWAEDKNGDLTPASISFGSNDKVWWRCSVDHEWRATVKSRVHGCGCPVCQNRVVLAGLNDLATKYPDLALEWHPVKNKPVMPNEVFSGSVKKYWWKCEKGHEWCAGIAARTNGEGCPYCAGKKVCRGYNDLQTLFPMIAKQWNTEKNGILTPTDVTAFSNKKVWWLCEKGHTWQAVIASRTSNRCQCPYCTGKKVLKGFNDLETLKPRIASEWHPTMNGNLTPNMVSCGSHKKVWWKCSEGHEWCAKVFSRAGTQQTGCPECAGKKRPYETLNVYLAK